MELFRNPHDALMFAMRFSSQQYAQSPMAQQLRRAEAEAGGLATIGSGKGLVALDGAAQAGIILGRVDKLHALHRACIIGRFSARVEPCCSCGGEKPLDAYKGAIMTLASWAEQFVPSTRTEHRLRYAIVQEYFERCKAIGAAAERIGISKRTAYDQKAKIWPQLVDLDKTAITAAGALLEDMIGEVSA
jgi:hypothetical protein